MTESRTYYLAAWQAIAAGSVPSDVVAKVCPDDSGDDTGAKCVTTKEVWSLTDTTRTITVLRTVQYTGIISGVSTSATISIVF